MALPALVLVHGGGLAADSWELTVEEIHRLAPELTVLALDMPGRRNKPETCGRWPSQTMWTRSSATSRAPGWRTLSSSLTRWGVCRCPEWSPSLERRGCEKWSSPPPFSRRKARRIVESSPWVIRTIARRRAKKNVPTPTPKWYARFVFLNGVPSHGRRFMAGKLYAESLLMLIEKVSRRGMPDDIPRTWILTRRDRALAPKVQRKYIEALGGVQKVIEIDTCHCLMVSEPERLAEILVERCRLYV